ncbi:GNAT family N-acetyltransferase [Microbacterium sp.]|uniref:GNAT family N-acetyltransferase n=1 Tax=Microbacterium sp. TaxID=51671 RepID=UPI0026068C50|nr:GNAT family N-acetyltransferase [Microbacterium sp.]
MAQLTHHDAVAERAATDAQRAAVAAGVSIRELTGINEQAAAISLLAEIWKRSPENPPVPPELLRAMSKAGNYIGGAFAGETLIGVAIAFHSGPERHALHSHIAGVSAEHTGRAAGFALKQHQRAWALARGIDLIEWTFDPLVARNAYFNIVKLGAHPAEYLANFYGEIADGVNNDDETDRVLISWQLTSDTAIACAAGTPVRAAREDGDEYVAIPADIEQVRQEDRAAARRWRRDVRTRLTTLLDSGAQIVGFDRTEGYLVRPRKDS